MAKEQPSSIDKLPEEIRAEIGRLRIQGRTILEIVEHLRGMDVNVSKSALGRHVKSMAALRERLQNSRNIATALVDQYGDKPDNKLQRLNIELMHGIVMQTMTAAVENEDGEAQPITFSPEDAMFLASALQKLASAQKTDTDRNLTLQREMAKQAASRAEDAMKARGMSAETIDAIKHAVLGVAT
jgi:arginine repressor